MANTQQSGAVEGSRARWQPEVTLDFNKWLWANLGHCKYFVGRSNKKLRKNGYNRFFTQKRFRLLQAQYEREQQEMGETSPHLTKPNVVLEEMRRRTPPGMAHWAGTGPEGATCRGCAHWKTTGYLAGSGLLKNSPCDKYRRMMGGVDGPPIPHYAPACKWIEPREKELSIEDRGGK